MTPTPPLSTNAKIFLNLMKFDRFPAQSYQIYVIFNALVRKKYNKHIIVYM
jgi:hypothetical protein